MKLVAIGTVRIGVVMMLLCGVSAPARAQRASEAEVKAALIFSFAKFVEWPPEALPPGADFVICIAGDDAIANAIRRVIQDRKLNQHELSVQSRTADIAEFNGCHLVFIGDRRQWQRAFKLLRGEPVLTIADGEEFARKGGVVAFVLENDRVRFVMNPAAGERAGLKISSRLLALARIVQEEKGF